MHSNYKNVTDLSTVYKYVKNSEIVAFDYETAPDEEYRQEEKAALDPHKAHIVGCSFSVLQGTGIYVPIAHKTGQNADKDKFFVFLRDFLTDEGIIKVAHNLSFESQMSYAMGIVIKPPVYDTMSAAQMTLKNSYKFRGLHECGLKNWQMKYVRNLFPLLTLSQEADFSMSLTHRTVKQYGMPAQILTFP